MPRLTVRIPESVATPTEETAAQLPDLITRALMASPHPFADLELIAQLSRIENPAKLAGDFPNGSTVGYEFLNPGCTFVDVYLKPEATGTIVTIDYFKLETQKLLPQNEFTLQN